MNLRLAARAAIVIALVVAAPAGAVPAPAAAAAPAPAFFGIQGWNVPTARDLAVMKRGGVGSYRAVFDGEHLGTSYDSAGWAGWDTFMTAAARERIEVLPVLQNIPGARTRFQHPRTRGQRTAWAGFVSAVARRYGRGGTFWEARPELEPMPLTAYQVWNEPNLPVFWRPAPDAAGYLRLVRLTRARLRAVDPKASVVLAGLPNSRLGVPALDYLRAIYAEPGAREAFDVVALHPYAPNAGGVVASLTRVRAYMDRRGDRATPIWVTELGWGTGGPRTSLRTTKAGQAAKFDRTLRALLAARGRLRLERFVAFALQDREFGEEEAPWWAPRAGLFDRAGQPKPAWRTFVRLTGGHPGGRLRRAAGWPQSAP